VKDLVYPTPVQIHDAGNFGQRQTRCLCLSKAFSPDLSSFLKLSLRLLKSSLSAANGDASLLGFFRHESPSLGSCSPFQHAAVPTLTRLEEQIRLGRPKPQGLGR
jgi:hypothetical protein